ncbi:hypothetical protein [Vibrio sp. SCSIO 43136]|uniref:hypothetical protein n=1 Tax=Vibrio sp. SCSIO 43136 TaxID=2819101 RepID=UPI002075C7DB|nr:hypothetical protein [Vibrio sp. SCSIO 43136]USD65090.1 hypothetical protein J4N39_13705 [Vibrio sp. SCSIO 43136]
MSYQYSFPIKRALLGVTAIFGVFLLLILIDALDEAQEEYQIEQNQLMMQLRDMTHTLRSVEFEMTSHSEMHQNHYPYPVLKKSVGDTCYLFSEMSRGNKFDFVFSGPPNMCGKQDAMATLAESMLPSATVMSYLVGLVDKVSSIYFISRDKFIISSPALLAEHVHGGDFDEIIEERPFWVNTIRHGLAEHPGGITFTGEYEDLILGQQVVTLTVGVHKDGEFIGVLGLDSLASKIKGRYQREYKISDWEGSNTMGLTHYAISKPLQGQGLDTRLYLNVEQNWKQHLSHLWHSKQYVLITLFFTYLLAIGLLLRKSYSSMLAYERYLLFNHAQTGLLNLAGIEESLKEMSEKPYLAVTVIQPNTWKDYQDVYGIDVAEQVETHIINLLKQRLRDIDVFGMGEHGELIILMPAESEYHANWLFNAFSEELALTPCRLAQGGKLVVKTDHASHCFPVHHYDGFSHLWHVEQRTVLTKLRDEPSSQHGLSAITSE